MKSDTVKACYYLPPIIFQIQMNSIETQLSEVTGNEGNYINKIASSKIVNVLISIVSKMLILYGYSVS